MNKPFTIAAVVLSGCLFAAGCQKDQASMRTTAPDVTPDSSGTHYNGAVNSTGSGAGTNMPTGSGGTSLNGGSTSPGPSLNRMGTSDQNGGSAAPTGTSR